MSAEVIDLRTIRPLDTATILASVRKTNRLVVVDENFPMVSVASEVAYRVQKDAFDFLDAPVLRINQADTPLPFSAPLIDASLPNAARVITPAEPEPLEHADESAAGDGLAGNPAIDLDADQPGDGVILVPGGGEAGSVLRVAERDRVEILQNDDGDLRFLFGFARSPQGERFNEARRPRLAVDIEPDVAERQ